MIPPFDENGYLPPGIHPMTIRSQRELAVTKRKLRELEEQFRLQSETPTSDPHRRDLSLRSIKKWMNRLTDEIVHYEAHAQVRR